MLDVEEVVVVMDPVVASPEQAELETRKLLDRSSH